MTDKRRKNLEKIEEKVIVVEGRRFLLFLPLRNTSANHKDLNTDILEKWFLGMLFLFPPDLGIYAFSHAPVPSAELIFP